LARGARASVGFASGSLNDRIAAANTRPIDHVKPIPALTAEEIAAIAEQARRRVRRWFAHSGLLDADDARDALAWDNAGFSLDASVRISGQDRAGLERLLRYCARSPFALERLEKVTAHQLIYRLPKPGRAGRSALSLTPLELIDHLAALIPPP